MYWSCASRFFMSLKPNFTLVSPPRSSPNISSARGNHLLIACWIDLHGDERVALRGALRPARSGITPAARWNASSRSIGGIESAIGL